MSDLETVERMLLAEGSYFHVVKDDVGGVKMDVFTTRPQNLRELLERTRAFGERPYVVFGDETLSYDVHLKRVASLARAFRERFGVQRGDRVAILAANCPDWVVAFWAAVSLGALPVGMNGWWVGPEIEFALADAEPKLLIADQKRLDRVKGMAPCPVLRVGSEVDALVREFATEDLPDEPISEDDDAVILYSSGTTGRPKGIVATHRNILALVGIQTFHGARVKLYEKVLNGEPPELAPPAGPPAPALVSTPLFHVSGLYAGIITRLAIGGTTVWTVGRYDPALVAELIERHGIGGWGPTTTMVRRLLDSEASGQRDLSSLEFIGIGGSHVPQALMAELRERLPGTKFAAAVGYGLTEACALVSIHFGPEYLARPDSVGRPLPTVDVQIRDSEGQEVSEGEVGEICVRSPLVMSRYWRRDEATRAAFWPERWLRTGDIGVMRDGFLHIPARRRDLIIRGGENIYPAEIEHALEAHPDVLEAAVIGRDHRDLGQVPHAVVVAHQGAVVGAEELSDWVGERLAYFKVPATWAVQSEPLPRNASDKVMKHLLESSGESAFVEVSEGR